MRFLIAAGGIDDVYGILTSYKHKGVPSGIVAGLPWAGDNCAFTGFDGERFTGWLAAMTAYRASCLFIAVPDVVGDAVATLARWHAGMNGRSKWTAGHWPT